MPTQDALVLIAKKGTARSACFQAAGQLLLAASPDGTCQTWDASTGHNLLTRQVPQGCVSSIAVHPDGSQLAWGNDNHTVLVEELTTGKSLQILNGHTGPVQAVAFSPNGLHLVSGSADQTAIVWDAESGKALATLLGHTDTVLGVAFDLDGKHLISGGADKTDPPLGRRSPVRIGLAPAGAYCRARSPPWRSATTASTLPRGMLTAASASGTRTPAGNYSGWPGTNKRYWRWPSASTTLAIVRRRRPDALLEPEIGGLDALKGLG